MRATPEIYGSRGGLPSKIPTPTTTNGNSSTPNRVMDVGTIIKQFVGFTLFAYVDVTACSNWNYKGYITSIIKSVQDAQGFAFFCYQTKLRYVSLF